jgi:histidyl-tRNA synthetase
VKVLVIPMDSDAMDYSIEVAGTFRNSEIVTDVYYQSKGLKPKMKYADRLGIPYVAIIGADEVASQKVTLKNMKTNEQKTVGVNEAVETLKNS